MKVKLVKSSSPDSWYKPLNGNLLGKTFNVQFEESASEKLSKNVYVILTGEFKGRLLEVKDTKIVVNI